MTLARTILDLQRAGAEIVYGEATAKNTVEIEGASTAVVLPALDDVRSGEYVAIARTGADMLILGSIGRDWTAYTPTWTNLTVGDATQDFRWRYVPGGAAVNGVFTFGSTSSITSVVSFTLPSGVSAIATGLPLGTVHYDDAGAIGSDEAGVAWSVGSSSVRITWGPGGNWTSAGTASSPASGDRYAINLFVPIA